MLNLFHFLTIAMAINLSSWKSTIPVMIFGMVGIFIVIGVIIIATYLINKAFSKKKKDTDDK